MSKLFIHSSMLAFFCMGCFFFPAKNQKPKREQPTEETLKKDSIFNIQKIDSLNNFYILYASRQGKLYKIIEEKKGFTNCNFITVGSYQYLNLRSILNKPVTIDSVTFSSSNSLSVNCFTFGKGTIICKEDGIDDLYQALNLEGLCIKKNYH